MTEPFDKNIIRNIKDSEGNDIQDIMVISTGGGLWPTITKRAWKILSRTERKVQFLGY